MTRIGFVAGTLGGGNGWARLSFETIRHVAALGLDCRVVVRADAAAHHAQISIAEPRPVLPPWPQSLARWPLAVAKTLPAAARALSDCDLVHCLMEPYLSTASLVCRLKRRPLVATAVGTYSAIAHAGLSPFAFWSNNAERIVCISRYTEKRLRARVPSSPSVVVNPGVDSVRFCPGTPSGAAASVEGRVILSVGAVKPRKGYDVVIEALARLDTTLGAKLFIIGSEDSHPDYAASLRQLAVRLGVGERVHFLGVISEDDVIDWYRRADAFILNAANRGDHFEGFGLVLLEANACGTPVVACRDSGAEDIVVPRENGELVNQNDPAATARALTMLLQDRDRTRKMAECGLRRAREMTWERSARELVAVYEQVLSGRRPAKVTVQQVEQER